MVSELAGEGAPLPAPASHVKLRRFGENRSVVIFFQSSTSQSVKFFSKMLFSPLSTVFSRSRSENSSSKVLDYPPSVSFNLSLWSRSMESVGEIMSTVLISSTSVAISCSAVKGSAIEGENEILVELEEQLLNMRFQSLHQNNRYISSALEYSESVSSGSGLSGQECGNTLSTLSFGTAVRGKAGENWFANVHDLMFLCNWHLQWCFVNAKTDSAYFKLTETAEWNLYNAQLATPKLLHSVKSKQTELFLLKQNFKLYHICSAVNMVHEMAYSETSESVETEAVKEGTYVEVGTLAAKENSEMISHSTEREVVGEATPTTERYSGLRVASSRDGGGEARLPVARSLEKTAGALKKP
nr:QWRF motif-containing protein 2-like [Ipomoea batatas]